jgi:hypothetical protein
VRPLDDGQDLRDRPEQHGLREDEEDAQQRHPAPVIDACGRGDADAGYPSQDHGQTALDQNLLQHLPLPRAEKTAVETLPAPRQLCQTRVSSEPFTLARPASSLSAVTLSDTPSREGAPVCYEACGSRRLAARERRGAVNLKTCITIGRREQLRVRRGRPLGANLAAYGLVMIPRAEFDRLLSDIKRAVGCATLGGLVSGYDILLGGLRRAEYARMDGQEWGPALVARYRQAIEEYERFYGTRVE